MDLKYIIGDPVKEQNEIDQLLGSVKANEEKVWIWQDSLDEEEKPLVHFGLLIKYDDIKGVGEFKPTTEEGFNFRPELEINVYSPGFMLWYKFYPKETRDRKVTFSRPPQLSKLDSEFVQSLELIEIENEQENMHMRQTPRMQAKGNKRVGVQKANDPLERLREYALYDMSQTGAGFIVDNPALYERGHKVVLLTMNGKKLDSPLRGRIMAVRQMDDDEEFKVGVMFDVQKNN
ncbi:MAG: PilZ domain-containing protein [Bacteriovoracaceae bacterium]|nr:PilZ domain-containing protein [Bacteriovoracaceae bacterium]